VRGPAAQTTIALDERVLPADARLAKAPDTGGIVASAPSIAAFGDAVLRGELLGRGTPTDDELPGHRRWTRIPLLRARHGPHLYERASRPGLGRIRQRCGLRQHARAARARCACSLSRRPCPPRRSRRTDDALPLSMWKEQPRTESARSRATEQLARSVGAGAPLARQCGGRPRWRRHSGGEEWRTVSAQELRPRRSRRSRTASRARAPGRARTVLGRVAADTSSDGACGV
jgi:hypothetical protein